MTKTQANLGMALEIPKRRGIPHFDNCNAHSIIFLSDQLDRSPEGDLNLVEDRNKVYSKSCAIRAD